MEFPRTLFFITALALHTSPLSLSQSQGDDQARYRNPGVPSEERIADLLGRLTLEEKVSLVSGTGFESRAIARLGIPALNMTDGPVGVRWEKSTAFPVSIAMAATWNPSLVGRVGWALAREAKARGRRMLLAPCININRVPHGGRSFESFGEDPFLASRMTVSYVRAVQEQKVAASTKHFAVNNQEWERTTIDVRVDERTLREIYLPAFQAAVQEAGTRTIMAAYNKLNGAYCAENSWLLSEVLKKEWGFTGFVVSDWGAVHSTTPTANAGLDIEMPDGRFLGDSLLQAVKRGEVSAATIDDKVVRLLRVIFWTGLFDEKTNADTSLVNSKEHREIALAVAKEGIVLLKNDNGMLPIDPRKLKSIAIVGPNADAARTGGGGSSMVSPFSSVSPLEGLRKKLGSNVSVRFARGCPMEGDVVAVDPSALRPPGGSEGMHGLRGDYYANMDLSGTPSITRIDQQVDFDWGDGPAAAGLPKDRFSVRWSGKIVPPKTGMYALSVASDDGVLLFSNNNMLIENWTDHGVEARAARVELVAGRSYDVKIEFYENGGGAIMRFGWWREDNEELQQAVDAARQLDVALVFAGTSSRIESEGFDRATIAMPTGQRELIEAGSLD